MPISWRKVREYKDIIYEHDAEGEGIAKITINRPKVRNAFRPQTVMEMLSAFQDAKDDARIGVILFTGAGDEAFCSGGDQRVRGDGGYVGDDGVPRLNVLELQRLIRQMPKPVIALVAGYAIGGGHVGSFDAGYGVSLLSRMVGDKKAREIWYLCRQYNAQQALDMGLVNTIVPLDKLEDEGVQWAREILEKSPMAIRFLKMAVNADADGAMGMQQFAGDATLLYYLSEEAKEGKNAYLEKRKPNFKKFKRFP